MIRTLTVAALSAALIAPSARAKQATADKMAVSDALFAMTAADGGLTEVTLAELGAKKATDPELKKFSQHMIEEHTKMNAELTNLAARKRMALPREMSYGHQFCAQSLAGLSGEEFDRCYAKAQLVLHMSSLAAFEAEAKENSAFFRAGIPNDRDPSRPSCLTSACRSWRESRSWPGFPPSRSSQPCPPSRPSRWSCRPYRSSRPSPWRAGSP